MTAARARTAPSVVLLLALLVLVAGCGVFGGGDDAPQSYGEGGTLSPSPVAPTGEGDTGDAAPEDPALARFYEQRLSWRDCKDSGAPRARCARLEVPVDYGAPDGETLQLALLKMPAEGDGEPLGSLVVNPGGPGGSGVDYAKAADQVFGPEVRANFDVVGFDPRGVIRSEPVRCLPDDRLNEILDTDPDPDTPAEVSTFERDLRELGRGCLQRSGDLARHVSTVEVARDMDVLRGALGEDRLTYFGASYGTLIGATYADMFPGRVGRLVLDGGLDPTLTTVRLNLEQARGFETALGAFVANCVEDGDCVLGSSVDEGTRRLESFMEGLEDDPLPAGDRTLTAGNAVYGVFFPLYAEASWPVLEQALERAIDQGDGELLMTLADAYLTRTADGHFKDNSFEVFNAVNCLDHGDAVPSDQVDDLLPRFERASPTFGSYFAWSTTTCSEWPVPAEGGSMTRDAEGAAPILVIGTTRDPATPYAWSQSLAEQLDSGILVTRDGDGHTGYRQGDACVDETVESYLVSGTVPEGDVNCE